MIPARPPTCPGGCQQGRRPACRGQYRELREVSATDQAIRASQTTSYPFRPMT